MRNSGWERPDYTVTPSAQKGRRSLALAGSLFASMVVALPIEASAEEGASVPIAVVSTSPSENNFTKKYPSSGVSIKISTPRTKGDNGEIDVVVGVGSMHMHQRQDGRPWNQENTGVAGQYLFPTSSPTRPRYYAIAGQIKNSEFGETLMAGGGIDKTIFKGPLGSVSVGFFAGGITYPSHWYHTNHLYPALLPKLQICDPNRHCIGATLIPQMNNSRNASPAILFTGSLPVGR